MGVNLETVRDEEEIVFKSIEFWHGDYECVNPCIVLVEKHILVT